MSEAGFTKGPWSWFMTGDDRAIYIGKDLFGKSNATVAMIDSDDYLGDRQQQFLANAHLIAAAPDLYEALECLTDLARRMDFSDGVCCCGDSVEGHGFGSGHSPIDAGLYYSADAIQKSLAALAKARGETA